MNTAFTITASVKAICRATSTAPVLLRSIAINIGRNSIGALLTASSETGAGDMRHTRQVG